MKSPAPALTAIMLMPRSFDRLANSLAHLRRQTVRDQIEVILVHTAGSAHEIEPEHFEGFHSFRSVQLDEEFAPPAGFAAGFREGTAPVVAYIEDHVTLNPVWAEAILDAHRGPWAAVAPAMENGNHEGSLIGRTNFLMGFVEWYGHDGRREVTSGPGHNMTYKRAVLELHRERLSDLYRSERHLCYLLEAAGCRMVVEPRAVTRHVNISNFFPAMAHGYYGGVIFGAQRASSMKWLERVARTLLAPLVPPLRLWRIVSTLIARGKLAESGLGRVLPYLLLNLVLHATGEVVGYWCDPRDAESVYREFELNRLGCVDAIDRAMLLPSPSPHQPVYKAAA